MQSIPNHLQKYIVDQSSTKYTPIDQAVWRFILRQLKNYLKDHAHESYIEGLKETGINSECIPTISEISQHLSRHGWRALPVSGFIPPAAFMELQSLNVLPIASDMRSLDHHLYTPAPDIVHEAAGHAPMLINKEFASYLKKYSQVAKKAIISKEDLDLYEAIRLLSDLKENPGSTAEQIDQAEKNLKQISNSISHLSEAAELGRMNWWTAEYGLIGTLDNPKIFGAGLLSSMGESMSCLKSDVKKIPLTIDCLKYSYDITEPQPQLFVTPDFKHLENVLEEMASQMSFRTGGINALEKALKSKVVNSFELSSGLQIGGELEYYLLDENSRIIFVKFKGPSQLAVNDHEIYGHGKTHHAQGFSSPLGKLKNFNQCPSELTNSQWTELGLQTGADIELHFESGFTVKGTYLHRFCSEGKTLILSLKNAFVQYKNQIYFQPDWGQFDLVLGDKVSSVYAGPPDKISFGEISDFVAVRVIQPTYSEKQKKLHKIYSDIRFLRENAISGESLITGINTALVQLESEYDQEWLSVLELYELAFLNFKENSLTKKIYELLITRKNQFPNYSNSIEQGILLVQT